MQWTQGDRSEENNIANLVDCLYFKVLITISVLL